MKSLTLLVAVALFATQASTRFLDGTAASSNATMPAPNITFAATLKCGECVLGGYIFCAKSYADNTTVTADVATANRVCCKDAASCSSYT